MQGARIQESPLSLDALILDSARPDCGALAVFAGTVRNHHQLRPVVSLTYTAHVALAERLIREIEDQVCAQHAVPLCRVVHRIGPLGIGDVAIVAVVRAPHRKEAFAALRAAVDATKHTVPIWKEEFYADGSSAFVAGCCIGDGQDAAADVHDHAAAHRHAHEGQERHGHCVSVTTMLEEHW
jgi:molybdopterin synthase catalytic subunit